VRSISKASGPLAGLIGPNFEVPGNAAARIRDVASDGVDVIVEVAAGASAELDQAVLRPRGTISIYANDGGAPFNLDVRRNMGLNSRYQFVLLYTVGWELIYRRHRTSATAGAARRRRALPARSNRTRPQRASPVRLLQDRLCSASRVCTRGQKHTVRRRRMRAVAT
jgi:NADPH:quinone reductase-like Zn-dependent oxidoreductase